MSLVAIALSATACQKARNSGSHKVCLKAQKPLRHSVLAVLAVNDRVYAVNSDAFGFSFLLTAAVRSGLCRVNITALILSLVCPSASFIRGICHGQKPSAVFVIPYFVYIHICLRQGYQVPMMQIHRNLIF